MDERLGLPSASSFSMTAICPGREALLRSIESVPDLKDEFAVRGNRLHLAWEKENPFELNDEDTELYEEGIKLVGIAVQNWATEISASLSEIVEGKREERFWLRNETGNLVASGQADRHWYFNRFGLLLDFKSLYTPTLTPSELNWQLMLLAVMLAEQYDLKKVRCAFVKPTHRELDITDYDENDLLRARWSIDGIIWASKHILDRRAGPHCRHCKAVTACPEAKAYCLLPSVQSNALEGITPKNAAVIAERLDLKDCVRIWETQTSRRNIEDAIKERLKDLPEPVMEELGIKLGNGNILRTITNPRAAIDFLKSVNVPEEEIWKTVSLGTGDLAKIVQKALNKPSEKAATAWIREKLAAYITEKDADRPLQKI